MFAEWNGAFHRVSNELTFYDRTVVFRLVVCDFVSVQSLVTKALSRVTQWHVSLTVGVNFCNFVTGLLSRFKHISHYVSWGFLNNFSAQYDVL